jgi:rubrerythrin
MPDFTNPFSGMVPRRMTRTELVRALRMNLSAEEDATALYMAHADATDDPVAKQVLTDIANEERVHVGEFQELIRRLDPGEQEFLDAGALEVQELAASVAAGDDETAEAGGPGLTVGGLRDQE